MYLQLSEYELCIASNLIDPASMSVTWQDIGGLDGTVQEIKETVILPFARRDLFMGSLLLQPPKGNSRIFYLFIKSWRASMASLIMVTYKSIKVILCLQEDH